MQLLLPRNAMISLRIKEIVRNLTTFNRNMSVLPLQLRSRAVKTQRVILQYQQMVLVGEQTIDPMKTSARGDSCVAIFMDHLNLLLVVLHYLHKLKDAYLREMHCQVWAEGRLYQAPLVMQIPSKTQIMKPRRN